MGMAYLAVPLRLETLQHPLAKTPWNTILRPLSFRSSDKSLENTLKSFTREASFFAI